MVSDPESVECNHVLHMVHAREVCMIMDRVFNISIPTAGNQELHLVMILTLNLMDGPCVPHSDSANYDSSGDRRLHVESMIELMLKWADHEFST